MSHLGGYRDIANSYEPIALANNAELSQVADGERQRSRSDSVDYVKQGLLGSLRSVSAPIAVEHSPMSQEAGACRPRRSSRHRSPAVYTADQARGRLLAVPRRRQALIHIAKPTACESVRAARHDAGCTSRLGWPVREAEQAGGRERHGDFSGFPVIRRESLEPPCPHQA